MRDDEREIERQDRGVHERLGRQIDKMKETILCEILRKRYGPTDQRKKASCGEERSHLETKKIQGERKHEMKTEKARQKHRNKAYEWPKTVERIIVRSRFWPACFLFWIDKP